MPRQERTKAPEQQEQETKPFCLAAYFTSEFAVADAFLRLQEVIYTTHAEHSLFTFQHNEHWHVAVVGRSATPALRRAFKEALTLRGGEITLLTPDMLKSLRADWIVQHSRPSTWPRLGYQTR